MNILLIGADGQLGSDIMKVFSQIPNPVTIKGLTIQDIDITDFSKTKNVIEKLKPDVIINTAAYHNVPECEKNPEKSFLVNTIAIRNLANLCRSLDIKLIHFSTDYVFDGKNKYPYNEDDTPNPLNVYAVSKLAGEYFVKFPPGLPASGGAKGDQGGSGAEAPWRPNGAHAYNYYIIRVASLFGTAGCLGKGGTNFVESMLSTVPPKRDGGKLSPRGASAPGGEAGKTLQVTANITSSPTYTYDAALKIKDMILDNYPSGLYHLTNSGSCSWYEFALEIFRLSNIKIKVEPKEEKEEQAGVRRPLFSPLTSKKLTPLRPWQDALAAYLKERRQSST